MIEVKNLTKKYSAKTALDNISFSVKEGEILGLLGPNGAGKSTTMNIMTGYLSADEGTVTIDGSEIYEDPIAAKSKIGYLPEIPPLYTDMTVKAYLEFIYDLKKAKVEKHAHIDDICSLVNIPDVKTRLIKNLSKGYRQRVGLAAALVNSPPVLILDEPTVGLDPKQIIEMRDLVKKLGEKHTVILSSHILPEVQAICDRIIVINNGKIVADNTPKNLSGDVNSKSKIFLQVEGDKAEIRQQLLKIEGIRKVSLGKKISENIYEFTIEAKDDIQARKRIFDICCKANYPILTMKLIEMSLEDIFLQLTENGPGENSLNKNKEENI